MKTNEYKLTAKIVKAKEYWKNDYAEMRLSINGISNDGVAGLLSSDVEIFQLKNCCGAIEIGEVESNFLDVCTKFSRKFDGTLSQVALIKLLLRSWLLEYNITNNGDAIVPFAYINVIYSKKKDKTQSAITKALDKCGFVSVGPLTNPGTGNKLKSYTINVPRFLRETRVIIG